jgi:imidazolonepropionase-like amidohydrolase
MEIKKSKILLLALISILLCCSCKTFSKEEHHSPIKKIYPSNTELVLTNCNLIDGTGRPTKKNMSISISKGLITDISKKNFKTGYPERITVMDLKGATVLPGFINAHVHNSYDETILQNWLKGGVTTVRDLGPWGSTDALKDRDTFNKNSTNSFLVSACPMLTVPEGYGQSSYNSAQDAKNIVKDFVDKDYDIIKFSIEDRLMGRNWTLPTYEEVKSIVDTAHANNKKASVHLTHQRNLQWAIDAGVDDISHMVTEPIDDKTIKEMIKKNIYWEPTLELWKGVSKIYELSLDSIAIENLGKFYKMGGKIALGTDFAGFSCKFDNGMPITEIHLMQEAGMSNMDIIVAATKNAAFVCGMDKEIGTIEVGKKADLLIVNGDPLSDIDVLSNIKMVIHNGYIVK